MAKAKKFVFSNIFFKFFSKIFGFYLPFFESRSENQITYMLICFLLIFKITIVSSIYIMSTQWNNINEKTKKVVKFAKKVDF